MLSISAQSIYDALRRTDSDIEVQIQQLKNQADKIGCGVHELTDDRGSYVLAPLLVAKASCLNGIAVLKAADLRGR